MRSLLILVLIAGSIYAQETTREEIIEQDIKEAISKLGAEYLGSFWAEEELISIGNPAIPHLIKAFKENKPKDPVKDTDKMIEIRRSIIRIFGEIRDNSEEVVDVLIESLSDTRVFGESLATTAAKALAKVGSERSIEPLIKILESDRARFDKQLKYELIRALDILRATQAEEVLIKALSDKAKSTEDDRAGYICVAAAQALVKIRSKKAINSLVSKDLIEDATVEPHSGKPINRFITSALSKLTGLNKGPLEGDQEVVSKTIEEWKKWAADKRTEIEREEKRKEALIKAQKTKEKLKKLSDAIETFRKDNQKLPEKLEDLKTNNYWKEDFKDAWGRELIYKTPGTGTSYDLISYAEDGKEGGSDIDQDIYNHDFWKIIKVEQTKKSMQLITDALALFKKDNEEYPKTLADLVTKPPTAKNWRQYLSDIPKDAFGGEFVYSIPGKENKPFDLISYGNDKKQGGEDIDQDISIWSFYSIPEEK